MEAHNEAHVADLAWLNAEVAKMSTLETARKITILTHHSPSIAEGTTDPVHANSKVSSGFSTDLSKEECWRNANVQLCTFGHTHYNCYFGDVVTKKRAVTNQRGYYFAQAAGFDGEKFISV